MAHGKRYSVVTVAAAESACHGNAPHSRFPGDEPVTQVETIIGERKPAQFVIAMRINTRL